MPRQNFMSNRRFFLAGASCAVANALLSGCVATSIPAAPDPSRNNEVKDAEASIDAPSLQIRVPKDSGVHAVAAEPGTFIAIRDLAFINLPVCDHALTATYQALPIVRVGGGYGADFFWQFYESFQGDSFVINYRREYGTEDSGVRYRLQYTVADNPADYVVTLKPVARKVYHPEMMVSTLALECSQEYANKAFADIYIAYVFEVDSQHPVDSVMTRFMYSVTGKVHQSVDSFISPLTGEVVSPVYGLDVGIRDLLFSVEAHPYHDGSKATFTVLIPGQLTSPGMIDFKLLIDKVKTAISDFMNA